MDNNPTIADLTVLETFIYFIIAWTLVAFWQRLAENIAYNTIGLNREVAYHNFIATFVTTIIFLVVVYYVPIIFRRFDYSYTHKTQNETFDQEDVSGSPIDLLQDKTDVVKQKDHYEFSRQVDSGNHRFHRKRRSRHVWEVS